MKRREHPVLSYRLSPASLVLHCLSIQQWPLSGGPYSLTLNFPDIIHCLTANHRFCHTSQSHDSLASTALDFQFHTACQIVKHVLIAFFTPNLNTVSFIFCSCQSYSLPTIQNPSILYLPRKGRSPLQVVSARSSGA